MIKTETILRLCHILLQLDHECDIPADPDEVRDAIDKFFQEDQAVIAAGKQGKGEKYYEAICDMFYQTTENIHEILNL